MGYYNRGEGPPTKWCGQKKLCFERRAKVITFININEEAVPRLVGKVSQLLEMGMYIY